MLATQSTSTTNSRRISCSATSDSYATIGTVCENCCAKCLVKAVTSTKNEARRSYDYQSTDDLLLIRCNDNTVVTIASNFGSVVDGKLPRWSQAEKNKVPVALPTMFQVYNQLASINRR